MEDHLPRERLKRAAPLLLVAAPLALLALPWGGLGWAAAGAIAGVSLSGST